MSATKRKNLPPPADQKENTSSSKKAKPDKKAAVDNKSASSADDVKAGAKEEALLGPCAESPEVEVMLARMKAYLCKRLGWGTMLFCAQPKPGSELYITGSENHILFAVPDGWNAENYDEASEESRLAQADNIRRYGASYDAKVSSINVDNMQLVRSILRHPLLLRIISFDKNTDQAAVVGEVDFQLVNVSDKHRLEHVCDNAGPLGRCSRHVHLPCMDGAKRWVGLDRVTLDKEVNSVHVVHYNPYEECEELAKKIDSSLVASVVEENSSAWDQSYGEILDSASDNLQNDRPGMRAILLHLQTYCDASDNLLKCIKQEVEKQEVRQAGIE